MDDTQSTTVSFVTALPHAGDTHIHVRLTTRAKCLVVSVTTASTDAPEALSSLGSFVYAIPNKFQPDDPLCTTLYDDGLSLEFAVRLAKMLVRKSQGLVYVSSSLDVQRMGLGGTVEEVIEAFRAVTVPLLSYLPRPGQGLPSSDR